MDTSQANRAPIFDIAEATHQSQQLARRVQRVVNRIVGATLPPQPDAGASEVSGVLPSAAAEARRTMLEIDHANIALSRLEGALDVREETEQTKGVGVGDPSRVGGW